MTLSSYCNFVYILIFLKRIIQVLNFQITIGRVQDKLDVAE